MFDTRIERMDGESDQPGAMTLAGVVELIRGCVSGARDMATRLGRIAELAADSLASAKAEALECSVTAGPVDEAMIRASLGAEIALARRESPVAGRRHLNLGSALTFLPHIRDCLWRGETDEFRVLLVARELACLSESDRAKADLLVAQKLPKLGVRSARSCAAGVVAQLDPETALAKIKAATKGRHVSIRALPDAMVQLSATLPAIAGISAYASLCQHADSIAAGGEAVTRGRGEIMADEFLLRLMAGRRKSNARGRSASRGAGQDDRRGGAVDGLDGGGDILGGSGDGPYEADDAVLRDAPASDRGAASAAAETAHDGRVRTMTVDEYGLPDGELTVDIHLVMTDRALLDGDDEPAVIPGYGPIPAALARRLVGAPRSGTVFVRRLFADPRTHRLIDIDRRRRLFPESAKRFLVARDQICRTPWCDAPIRQHDHVVGFARGGPTDPANGQGMCAACNLVKEVAGWRQHVIDGGGVRITTPAGLDYVSLPPEQPYSEPWVTARFEDLERPEPVLVSAP